jgi:hypothetical protein
MNPSCLDLMAVEDALTVGADVERDVCGSGKDGKPSCPFRATCGYQRQKAAVRSADVVIAAHQHLFHKLPSVMGKHIGLVVVDESWWQNGLNPGRCVNATTFAKAVEHNPVLRGTKHTQQIDGTATQELLFYAQKAATAFAATPIGQHVTRATVEAAGLTVAEARAAAKMEWGRKRNPGIRPAMPAQARHEAVRAAKVNATLGRRAGVWHALADLLASDDAASGRLVVTEGEDGSKNLLLHSRREIHEDVASLPMALLDATLPLKIVSHFLPQITILADVAVAAPHMTVNQIVAGWGKTSLIPHPGASAEENRRRDGLLSELRDFVAFLGGHSGLVVTYQQIEERFSNLAGVRTGHFNAISGLDSFGTVESLFVIGRPLPAHSELRPLALALTGRVIPDEASTGITRGALMADGTGTPLQVRSYQDPDLEAVRAAITDAEIVQAIGRARGVNRTADNPVKVWVLADVLLPLPLNRLARWPDVRLSTVQRMAARGLLLTSPSDAAAFFPTCSRTGTARGAATRLLSGR